jgi:hypothetical protein
MRDQRLNPDLDAAFLGAAGDINSLKLPKQRRKKAAPGKRDVLRRKAFRVLALLSDLNAADRLAVLRTAERLNRA